MVADAAVRRITFEPKAVTFTPLDWPTGLAPTPVTQAPAAHDAPMPAADIFVPTYTTAEAMALADVLTPGMHFREWVAYDEGWSSFEPHFTERSPAREEKCLAYYWQTMIGDVRVNVAKLNLHLSTDDLTLPVRSLIAQMYTESGAWLAITTGTAGGTGEDTQLGDVLITGTGKFNCTGAFKGQSWAQQRMVSPANTELVEMLGGHAPSVVHAVTSLMPVNAGRLRSSPIPPTRNPTIFHALNTPNADVQTMDEFGFAAAGDPYHVVEDDAQTRMEEMDDCVFGLVPGCRWVSVRNASDPQMPAGTLAEMKAEAERIYQDFGYYTALNSVEATWGVAVDMARARRSH